MPFPIYIPTPDEKEAMQWLTERGYWLFCNPDGNLVFCDTEKVVKVGKEKIAKKDFWQYEHKKALEIKNHLTTKPQRNGKI